MATAKVNPIPEGFHTVTPYLILKGADKVLQFIQKAFDAKIINEIKNEDGSIMHAQAQIGNSYIMLAEASENYPAKPSMIYLYVEDVDKVYKKALEAGATSLMPVQNEVYGDRAGGVQDPSGMQWWIATHIEEVSEEEMKKRLQNIKSK
ncbi:MAG TPA: VOC family protein [Cytophagaceae bacterium]